MRNLRHQRPQLDKMDLKTVRQAAKVKVKDIKLDRRTVAKIEAGDMSVTASNYLVYLTAIGLDLTYSLRQTIL